MKDLLSSLLDVLVLEAPTQEQSSLFFQLLLGSSQGFLSDPESEFLRFKTHIFRFIEDFKPLAFDEDFGFSPFSQTDVLLYLADPTTFYFTLNKAKGRGILYGPVHTRFRQGLLNGLSLSIRLAVFRRKLLYFDLIPKILQIAGESVFDCLDVQDIGAGHSVYRVVLAGGQGGSKSLVVKREESGNQSFFCQLLSQLTWPSFLTAHFRDEKGSWEISQDLGDQMLRSHHFHGVDQDQELLTQLARHAALGDVLGRGDRHDENYMVFGQCLYPLDITFLFWEGNEAWLKRYIASGMAEFGVMALFVNQGSGLSEAVTLFFNAYEETLSELSVKREKIYALIQVYFGQRDRDMPRKIQFVESRLENRKAYFSEMKRLYLEGFSELLNRWVYKKIVQKLLEKDPEILEPYPWIRMHAMADRDRLSCFFQWEERQTVISQHIQTLAFQYLNIPPSYFEEHRQRSEEIVLNLQRGRGSLP